MNKGGKRNDVDYPCILLGKFLGNAVFGTFHWF